MLDIFLVLFFGLMPPVVSLWLMHRLEAQAQEQISTRSQDHVETHALKLLRSEDMNYVEGVGYVIGDASCAYNARSPYIRCAVNPSGSCKECRFFAEHCQT